MYVNHVQTTVQNALVKILVFYALMVLQLIKDLARIFLQLNNNIYLDKY